MKKLVVLKGQKIPVIFCYEFTADCIKSVFVSYLV